MADASWRMVYSGGPIPMPDHEQIQDGAELTGDGDRNG